MSTKRAAKKIAPKTKTESIPSKPRATKKNTVSKKAIETPKKARVSKKTAKKVAPTELVATHPKPITELRADRLLESPGGRIGWMIKEIMLPILVPIAKQYGPIILREVLESAVRSAKNPMAKQILLVLKKTLF